MPLSDLLRQAMARTRTWTAASAEVERERTRQIARVGNNLNQIARWANTHASAIDTVEVPPSESVLPRRLGKHQTGRLARGSGRVQAAGFAQDLASLRSQWLNIRLLVTITERRS